MIDPIDFDCLFCGSSAGNSCVSPKGNPCATHKRRITMALNGGHQKAGRVAVKPDPAPEPEPKLNPLPEPEPEPEPYQLAEEEEAPANPHSPNVDALLEHWGRMALSTEPKEGKVAVDAWLALKRYADDRMKQAHSQVDDLAGELE